jgi:LmbE family N-acetylglucosaminyl deacetylase
MQLEQPLAQPATILVVAAHPDDIEFGAGGAVAKWSKAGHRVVFCIVTNGAAGSNDPDMQPGRLIALRREEQAAAAAKLGVHDVRFLGYPDGALEATLELRRQLTRLIRELKPYRVVLMDPTTMLVQGDDFNYINHPDHRAAGEAALYAVFPSAGTRLVFPELLTDGLEPHNVTEVYMTLSMQPNVAVDISDVLEDKLEALLCHRSQLDERAAEMVRKWDEQAGKDAGVPYAETFRVMSFSRDGKAADNKENGS